MNDACNANKKTIVILVMSTAVQYTIDEYTTWRIS